MFFPVILAQKKKLNIKTVTVPFQYPLVQKKNEEVMEMSLFLEKRRNQRVGILASVMHFIGFLDGHKESRIRSF